MTTTMRLLLLLSAFLTAMVGVGTPAVATVRPVCEVSATASVRVERQAPRITVAAPRKLGVADLVAMGSVALHAAPVRIVPIYAERLRV